MFLEWLSMKWHCELKYTPNKIEIVCNYRHWASCALYTMLYTNSFLFSKMQAQNKEIHSLNSSTFGQIGKRLDSLILELALKSNLNGYRVWFYVVRISHTMEL